MNHYCSAVDNGLFVSVNGQVGLCCSGSYPLGNIREQPIDEIFSSQKFINIKSDLDNNLPNDYCSGCYDIEKTAPGSSQMSAFNAYYTSDGTRKIKLADIRWSNICNLSCRYCNIQDSSEWRKLMRLPIEKVDRDYTESLFQDIINNKDNIDSLYLLGGEPLMQKHNERLLSIINKNVKIDILTNGAVKLDNNKIYQALKEFPNIYWNLSFDTVGDRFEYVRQGADWELFKSNVKTLLNDFGKGHVTFHPVYHVWNALNLKEFYDFANDMGGLLVNWQLGLPKSDDAFPTDGFLTFGHNKKIIQRAIQEIDRLGIENETLSGIRESLLADTPDNNKGERFLKWINEMEQFMPPKKPFDELWPELNTLLKETE
mgnify:CR=1 FL=1|tara:strand:- start:572 stop:1687 length:1116 start_codon:yes stop_codon:yes gene_type:complete